MEGPPGQLDHSGGIWMRGIIPTAKLIDPNPLRAPLDPQSLELFYNLLFSPLEDIDPLQVPLQVRSFPMMLC